MIHCVVAYDKKTLYTYETAYILNHYTRMLAQSPSLEEEEES